MGNQYLQLNAGKTTTVLIKGVFLDYVVCVRMSPVVNSLSSRFDCDITLKQQVQNLKSLCYIKLLNTASIKSFFTP